MQIRSEVVVQIPNRQTDKQTNDDYISSLGLAEVTILLNKVSSVP